MSSIAVSENPLLIRTGRFRVDINGIHFGSAVKMAFFFVKEQKGKSKSKKVVANKLPRMLQREGGKTKKKTKRKIKYKK